MANKHMRRCSASLVTRQMHVDTTTSRTPTGVNRIKKKEASGGEDVDELGSPRTGGGRGNGTTWASRLAAPRRANVRPPNDEVNSTSREMKTRPRGNGDATARSSRRPSADGERGSGGGKSSHGTRVRPRKE